MSRRKAKRPAGGQRKISEVLHRVTRRKRFKALLVFTLIMLVFGIFVIGKRGTYQLLLFWRTKVEVGEDINNLKQKNEKLRAIKKKLREDPEYIEKVAREKYKMKKKDERVYQVVEE